MKYRVLWEPYAESQLERILGETTDQARIVAATRAIDGQLLTAPLEFGESRWDTVRIGFERPLGVLYDILDDVRTVIVYEVWFIE
jgi:mRNA-degrading endonuclease RelE of RelBE toxin-antitoxin system